MKMIWKYSYYILFLCTIGCIGKGNTLSDTTIVFPEDSHTILQINKKNDFLTKTTLNTFWKSYKANFPDNSSKEVLKSIQNEPVYIAYTQKDVYFISILKDDSTSIWKNTSKNTIDSTILYKKKWFYTRDGDKLLISSSKNLTNFSENNYKEEKSPLYELQKTINKDYVANLFLNKEQTSLFFDKIFPSKVTKKLSNWSAWDILLEKNKIQLNGSALMDKDSTSVASLVNTKPLKIQSEEVIPQNIKMVQIFTFSDAEDLQLKFPTETDFHKHIQEVFIFSLKNHKKAIGVVFSDIEETLQQLFIIKEEIYQGQKIFSFENTADFNQFLSNFTEIKTFSKAFLYNSSLIFAENELILQDIINELQTNNNLVNNLNYKELKSNAISNVSYTEIVNFSKNNSFNKNYKNISDTYPYGLLQMTSQDEYLICNFVSIIPSQKEVPRGNLTEKYHITLDTEAHTTPKWIKNHTTHRKELVVQDIEDYLYLFDNQGKRIWKKKINGKIQSDISQVDLFKNGNLQMAFSTEKAIYVMDRNGNMVNPFPIVSKENILPLEIFDYDNNLNYRFVMATDKTIKLFDKNAKQIQGFEKTNVKNTILQTPKHFRINSKDYVIYPDKSGKLNILHRNGKERLIVKEMFKFSKNPLYVDTDWLVFTTKDGKQIFVDEKAGARTAHRDLSEEHFIAYKYETEVIVSDNKLIINKKEITLPYGIYEKPKIFRIGKTIYISVTDLQNNKIYLYTSQGNPLPNFPIFGSSIIDVTIDNGKPLFAFLKDKKRIYVYEF